MGASCVNTASKRHALVFGFSNAKRCTSHGKRKQGCTAVHNAPGVGITTKLTCTRHSQLPIGAQYDHGTRDSNDRAIAALSKRTLPDRSEHSSSVPHMLYNRVHDTTENMDRPNDAISKRSYQDKTYRSSSVPYVISHRHHDNTKSNDRECITATGMSDHGDHNSFECSSVEVNEKRGHRRTRSQSPVLSLSKLGNNVRILYLLNHFIIFNYCFFLFFILVSLYLLQIIMNVLDDEQNLGE